MSQGYLYLVTACFSRRNQDLCPVLHQGNFAVNFVVIFHVFTGLQCRSWRYLYLLAFIVAQTSDPTPPLQDSFLRVFIRNCGSHYSSDYHLKVAPGCLLFQASIYCQEMYLQRGYFCRFLRTGFQPQISRIGIYWPGQGRWTGASAF